MRVLIACDSFKDALPANEVCRAIAKGILRVQPEAQVTQMPLSDGGEGVLDILRRTLSLRPITLEVLGPLGRPMTASYGLSADGGTAMVEMAEASGLQLLSLAERNPLLTSTFGTGQLLADARTRGAKRALLGIGGSATNDAGVGAAAALGWQFLDAQDRPVKPVGGNLRIIARIVAPPQMPFAQTDVLCDVTNPLYGPNGAAWIYGRQKGGTDQSLTELDAGLCHIAALMEKETGRKGLAQTPGAGAAGGLGYGALAFMNATLKRGIDMVLDLVGFDAAAAGADLLITGEGHLDGQSCHGKLVQGVCARAGHMPVIALCGKLSASPEQLKSIGLQAAYSINKVERPLPEMLAATAENLEKTAAEILLRRNADDTRMAANPLRTQIPIR
jgi:glycerate kinase